MTPGEHYEIVPEAAYNVLRDACGVRGPPICRGVRAYGRAGDELRVEVMKWNGMEWKYFGPRGAWAPSREWIGMEWKWSGNEVEMERKWNGSPSALAAAHKHELRAEVRLASPPPLDPEDRRGGRTCRPEASPP
jgi:hypothetical protein